MDENEKRQVREQLGARFQLVVNAIREDYTMTTPPYLDGPYSDGMRYYKAWQLWNRSDISRLDVRTLTVLHDMAECDDFGHLNQILPNYYRAHGGVRAFAQDIESTARSHGLLFHSAYAPNAQPQAPITTQASLNGLDQLARNAGQLANVTLHPASEILPATVKAASSLARAA